MIPLDQLKQKTIEKFDAHPLFRSGGFAPFKHEVCEALTQAIEEAWEAGVNSEDIKDPL